MPKSITIKETNGKRRTYWLSTNYLALYNVERIELCKMKVSKSRLRLLIIAQIRVNH